MKQKMNLEDNREHKTGNIDLFSAVHEHLDDVEIATGISLPSRPAAIRFSDCAGDIHPIESRQVAAVVVAMAEHIARQPGQE